MNTLVSTLIACSITLGFKHNSLSKKIMHISVCLTIFFLCNQLLWIRGVYFSLYVTMIYMIIMMIWTFYIRYPVYCTYRGILTGFSSPHLSTLAKLNRHFILKPYTPKWKSEFLAEKARTNAVLLPKWKHILDPELSPDGFIHIGSTAITNIALAKPQHDCALAVNCHQLPEEFLKDLSTLNYSYIGVAPHSLDCADHFFFFLPDANDKNTLGEGYFLHVVTPKVHEWLRTSRAFCEYLSENQMARESYSNLKRQIINVESQIGEHSTYGIVSVYSLLFVFILGAYTMKKYDLVMKLRKEAKIWAENKHKIQ